jgi:hypothetical protein
VKEEEEEMTNIISRCSICGQYLNSKKALKAHKDKNHRITNSRIRMAASQITKPAAAKRHYQQENS